MYSYLLAEVFMDVAMSINFWLRGNGSIVQTLVLKEEAILLLALSVLRRGDSDRIINSYPRLVDNSREDTLKHMPPLPRFAIT